MLWSNGNPSERRTRITPSRVVHGQIEATVSVSGTSEFLNNISKPGATAVIPVPRKIHSIVLASSEHHESIVKTSFSGNQDWRFPNVVELSTVVDETETNPSINTTYFTDFVSTVYWTATTDPAHTTSAYVIYFNNFDSIFGRGGVGLQDKTGTAFSLCVRTQ